MGRKMKKRTFLKLGAAAGAHSLLRPLASWGAEKKLRNWAGNIEYSTEKLTPAATAAEAQRFVRAQEKFKVLGTAHCFNTIADSRNQFLSVRPMEEISVDAAARTVTVGGGITYGKLAPPLDAKGFALHNLASLPHISVAGACTTATHGSGEKNGNLASAVQGLELINAAGEVVELSRAKDGETLAGAVVGLGALGVISKVTLAIQPTFQVKQYVYENMPLAEMQKHFDEIEGSGYSVSLFTDWRNKNINEVWVKSRVDGGAAFAAPPEFFGARLAKKNLHPIAEISAENCTEQMGVPGPWYERLPHFRMGFTPSAGKELQSEFFVPRRNAVEAILAVEKLNAQISPLLLITEIRTIAADDLWMSPCYQQDSVAIHFTWKPDWPGVRAALPEIEKTLAPYGVRPHWGKLFTIDPATLRERYKRLPDFVGLAKRFDPNGKFRNEFLDKYVFGS